MSITEAQRHAMYEGFKSSHGDEIANSLMSSLPPVGWADVATKHDLDGLRHDFASLRREVDVEVGSLRREMEAGFASVRSDLRAEIHQAVRSQTWHLVTFVAAFNAVLVAVCSVVVATLV